jgi:Lrp/AsnC family transcriptional regulator for asnA, asnC and gidA
VEDDEHLLELLNEKIRKIEGVQATETYIYLRIHKETYQWGAAPPSGASRPGTRR